MNTRLSPYISSRQLEWRNDYRINRWTRQNGILTKSEHERWLASLHGDKSVKMFGIEGKPEEGWIALGTCGLTSIDLIHRTAEFSLFIAPEYQGKGHGKDALKLLLAHGFGSMNLHTIWGETFIENPALILFLKLGMTKEGIHRSRYEKDNERIDAISVSITKKEWYGNHT